VGMFRNQTGNRYQSRFFIHPARHALTLNFRSITIRGVPKSTNATAFLFAVLLIADLFHPVDYFAVERFLNGDMLHRSRRRSTVPMLLTRRKPDDIARPDVLGRAAATLRQSKARHDDERLA